MANAFVAAFEILSFGAIIVLIVLGLGIIASMMGIFNFAQGEFVLLGAYITYLAYAKGMPIWTGMVAAPFVVGALGFVLEALIIRRFYAAPIVAMLGTYALGLIIRESVRGLIGGITSSMRNAIKDPIVARGKTLYIYPQLYEGKECTPYLFCTGPTPAQQCDEFIPWLIKNGGKKFALPSANYVWPHTLNVYARKVIEANGGEVVFEEYYPLDQVDFSATVNRIISNKVDVVFNTVIPPGVGPFFKQLYEAGFLKSGGRLACVYYDENTLNINQAAEIEGLASCLDYFKVLTKENPFDAKIQAAYEKDFPGNFLFAAGSAATGTYRGLKLWEAAVKEAGKVDRDSVAAALDHAKIAEGPGGPAEMVPGKRHCKMKMYTAVAKAGNYEIVGRSNGLVDPKEC